MQPPPDVAILLDRFGSGGVERVACHVANGLHDAGLRVEVAVLDDTGPVRALLDPGIVVVCIGTSKIGRRDRRTIAAVPVIAKYLRERKPRVLHSPGNHTNRPVAIACAVARFPGVFVPKITNPILNARMSPRRRLTRKWAYRWVLRNAQAILVLTRAAIEEVTEIDPRLRDRVRVVHNPYVSEDMLAKAADRDPAEPPIILNIGRLSQQKNQALLLRAAARLGDRPWRVRICGTGPDEEALRALADELGIADRVDFAGFVSDPTQEYGMATVLAVSSQWEGLPAIVLEAIACGCPVVSTASSPGLVELLNDIGARSPVALNDEEGFAEALRAALEGNLPEVSNAASLPYSIEASRAEHAQLFDELLGNHRIR